MWRIKLALVLLILNTAGILSIIPYETTLMNNQFISDDMSTALIIIINSALQILYIFIMILIGLRLQNRAGLTTPILEGLIYHNKSVKISKKTLIISIIIAIIGSFFIILLDVFIFKPLIGSSINDIPSPNWWQGLLASIYGGITEETMLRLFGMTLIVWILAKITKKQKEDIPKSFYYIAILIVAVLFGLGHLPAAAKVYNELSVVIIVRTLMLNGILGLWFGYLYWKKGLEYAIIAHISADIFIHAIISPIFY